MILVTGGTGIVGSRILFELLKKGESVRALKRPNSDLNFVREVFSFYDKEEGDSYFEKIEWIDGNVNDIQTLIEAFRGVTQCYHAAALVSYRKADRNELIYTNAEGTANVVNIALEAGISKFCHISSVAALGRAANNSLTNEDDLWQPETNNSGYGLSKFMAEREVWRGIAEGLPAVIVNPGVILGPSKPHQSSGMLMAVLKKGVAFYPKGVVGYVDVRDVSRAAIQLMQSPIESDRFLLVSENKNYYDFLSAAAEVFGNSRPTVKLHPWMLSLAWRGAKLWGAITQKPPKITKEVARSASRKNAFENKKIKEAISFQFVRVEESLRYYRTFFE